MHVVRVKGQIFSEIKEGDKFDYAPWGGICVASWNSGELWVKRDDGRSTDGTCIWKTQSGGAEALLRGEEVMILWDNVAHQRAQMRDNRTIIVWHDGSPYEFRRAT